MQENSRDHSGKEDSSAAVEQYFSTLPPMVQESIKQSGLEFSSVRELKKYAGNLLDRK